MNMKIVYEKFSPYATGYEVQYEDITTGLWHSVKTVKIEYIFGTDKRSWFARLFDNKVFCVILNYREAIINARRKAYWIAQRTLSSTRTVRIIEHFKTCDEYSGYNVAWKDGSWRLGIY